MEFLVGAGVGIALTWWVFVTWIRPKNPLKFYTRCTKPGCDFVHAGNSYSDVKFITDAHEQWHKEEELS